MTLKSPPLRASLRKYSILSIVFSSFSLSIFMCLLTGKSLNNFCLSCKKSVNAESFKSSRIVVGWCMGALFIDELLTLLLLVFNLFDRFKLLFRLGHLQNVNLDSLTPLLCVLILLSLKNL
jgi:hypothetical protein